MGLPEQWAWVEEYATQYHSTVPLSSLVARTPWEDTLRVELEELLPSVVDHISRTAKEVAKVAAAQHILKGYTQDSDSQVKEGRKLTKKKKKKGSDDSGVDKKKKKKKTPKGDASEEAQPATPDDEFTPDHCNVTSGAPSPDMSSQVLVPDETPSLGDENRVLSEVVRRLEGHTRSNIEALLHSEGDEDSLVGLVQLIARMYDEFSFYVHLAAHCSTRVVHSNLLEPGNLVKKHCATLAKRLWSSFRTMERDGSVLDALFVDSPMHLLALRNRLASLYTHSWNLSSPAPLQLTFISGLTRADLAFTLGWRRVVDSQLQVLRVAVISEVSKASWKAHTAFFFDRTCTHAIHHLLLHFQQLCSITSSVPLFCDILVRTVTTVVARYLILTPSTFRAKQVLFDAVHFVRGVRTLRDFYTMQAPSAINPASVVDQSLVDFLAFAILLTAPLNTVVEAVKNMLRQVEGGVRLGTGIPNEIWMPPPVKQEGSVSTLYAALVGEDGAQHGRLVEAVAGCSLDIMLRQVSFERTRLEEVLSKRWELWDKYPEVPEEESGNVQSLKVAIRLLNQGFSMEQWDTVAGALSKCSS